MQEAVWLLTSLAGASEREAGCVRGWWEWICVCIPASGSQNCPSWHLLACVTPVLGDCPPEMTRGLLSAPHSCQALAHLRAPPSCSLTFSRSLLRCHLFGGGRLRPLLGLRDHPGEMQMLSVLLRVWLQECMCLSELIRWL